MAVVTRRSVLRSSLALGAAGAEVGSENAFMNAALDVMKQGLTPEAALDMAFKRAEAIFAKYPILAS